MSLTKPLTASITGVRVSEGEITLAQATTLEMVAVKPRLGDVTIVLPHDFATLVAKLRLVTIVIR